MNATDADQMLKVLQETNKNKTGPQLLSQGAPSPNEIWATIVAVGHKLDALEKQLKESKLK
tara:strand:- start:73 stop:255 length:183 start_codon:yes stop_codon:yes gene_type:complete